LKLEHKTGTKGENQFSYFLYELRSDGRQRTYPRNEESGDRKPKASGTGGSYPRRSEPCMAGERETL